MRNEEGSELVQFVCAFVCFFILLFSALQLSVVALSVNELNSDISRACRRIDSEGLLAAYNKNEFVKASILRNSDSLVDGNLQITRAAVKTSKSQGELLGQSATDKVTRAGRLQGHRQETTMSCEVTYQIPVLFQIPGFSSWELKRAIRCNYVDGKAVEVAWLS